MNVIKKVTPLKYNKIMIETSLGKKYNSDLSFFNKVHCYPTEADWKNVSIDKSGTDLIWSTKFKIKLIQIIEHAFKIE
jgi:hypothetical protein